MPKKQPFRTPNEVAQDHITAVLAGDPKQMAADYAHNAVLERDEGTYSGIREIEDYFLTVPKRLGESIIYFDQLIIEGSTATFFWRIVGERLEVSGTDVLTITNGEITYQKVNLNTPDF